MRKSALALLLFCPLALACAGGSSRYGCPAETGHSCRSVSEVYAAVASGGGGREVLPGSSGNGKNPGAGVERKFLGGEILSAGENTRGRAEDRKTAAAMPVYVPPGAIRIWIAPWQDGRGVFHSARYVYAVSGRGRWTIGGKTVTLGGPPGDDPGELRLLGTGETP